MVFSDVMDDGLVSEIKRGGAARNAKIAGLEQAWPAEPRWASANG